MTKGFRRRRDGHVEVWLSSDERTLLRQLVTEMLELLHPDTDDRGVNEDPLARMVGIGSSSTMPDDPVLARLFPDAYTDDPDAASDFRRFTQDSMWQDKRATVERVSASLADDPEHLVLDGEQAQAWLRTVNDVRLALGTRLEVTEEAHDDFTSMDADDPRYPGYAAYDWLSFLLETLVRALW